MNDTAVFTELEILGLTAVGESDALGADGMQQTINIVMNRVKANINWMGGAYARSVCLQKRQFNCWDQGTGDRQRIIDIGIRHPTYGPYLVALGLAERALAGNLPDLTNGSVSYVDGDTRACVHPGSQPHLIVGARKFYDLKAVA